MYPNSIVRHAEQNPIWQEEGGRLLVSVGTVPLKGAHSRDQAFKGAFNEWQTATEAGATSSGAGIAYSWEGPEMTWNPGSGILPFRVHIATPGRYRLALHSYYNESNAGCFVRIDGGQWWIALGGVSGTWSWITERETAPGVRVPWDHDFEEGFHLVEISGRAQGFHVAELSLVHAGLHEPGERDTAGHSPKRPR
jgi:hypothetical protein